LQGYPTFLRDPGALRSKRTLEGASGLTQPRDNKRVSIVRWLSLLIIKHHSHQIFLFWFAQVLSIFIPGKKQKNPTSVLLIRHHHSTEFLYGFVGGSYQTLLNAASSPS
jgi:hypothetical protein